MFLLFQSFISSPRRLPVTNARKYCLLWTSVSSTPQFLLQTLPQNNWGKLSNYHLGVVKTKPSIKCSFFRNQWAVDESGNLNFMQHGSKKINWLDANQMQIEVSRLNAFTLFWLIILQRVWLTNDFCRQLFHQNKQNNVIKVKWLDLVCRTLSKVS